MKLKLFGCRRMSIGRRLCCAKCFFLRICMYPIPNPAPKEHTDPSNRPPPPPNCWQNKSNTNIKIQLTDIPWQYIQYKYIYNTVAQFAAPTFSRGQICHRIGEGPNLPKTGLEDPRLQWNSSISILA